MFNIKSICTLCFMCFIVFSTAINAKSLKELATLSLSNDFMKANELSMQSIYDSAYASSAIYLPKVDLSFSDTSYKDTTSSGLDSNRDTTLSASLILFDGFARYNNIRGAMAYKDYAKNNLEYQKKTMILNVIKTYYGYLSTKELENSKIQEIEQLQAQYDRLQKFYIVGAETQENVLMIESSLYDSKVQLLSLQAKSFELLDILSYFTNNDNPNPKKDSIVVLPDTLNKSSTEYINSLEHNAKVLSHKAKVKLGDYLPTISLSLSNTKTNNFYEDTSNNDEVEQDKTTLTVSWNLFSSGASLKSYQSAQKAYLSKKLMLSYEKLKINNQYNLAKKNLEIAQQVIKALTLRVNASNKAYDSVLAKYQNSIIGYVVYLKALQDKHNAYASLQNAKYDLQIKKANLIYYSGGELMNSLR